MRQGDRHEHGQRDDLDHHQDRVEGGALLGAGHQHAGHHEGDQHRGQVDEAAVHVRAGGQRQRQVDAPAVQEADRVAGPAHRHRADHQRVLQDQAPAHHPGHRLAERGVTVGVGAAGGRHHGRQFGVGQRRAGADRAGDRKGDQHGRAGQVGADTDQGVDAGADDGADAQRDQVRPAEGRDQTPAGFMDGDGI
ncbi:hypothetical protein D3C72_1714270 [compost metagenome]